MTTPDPGLRKRQVAGVFDRAASTYDDVAGSYFSVLGPRLVDKVDISGGSTVVDVACGKGATILPAAVRCDPSGTVVGVDLSIEMTRHAIERASGEGLSNVHVAVMDGEVLALANACADTVICGFSMHFFPDAGKAIREFLRVLAPGGSLGISEWGATDERWAWEDDLIGMLPVKGVSSGSFDTAGALERLLSSAEVRDVDVTVEHVDITLVDEEEWWQWKWSYSFRHVLERLDPSVVARFKREAFERLDAMRSDTGIPLRLQALMATGRKP